jgi:hypothetical protein
VFPRILVATALGAGGLLGAVAVVAVPGSVWGAALCGAFVGVLVSLRDRGPGDAAAGRRAGLVAGAGTTGGLLALIGLVVLLGAAAGTLLLLALVVVGLVWTRRRTRSAAAAPGDPRAARPRGATSGDDPSPRGRAPQVAEPAPGTPSPDPADLTAPQLCAVWQRTYFALLDLPVGASREAVADLRGRLLDEMERRDPDGFARWLEAGPRAGSNPGPFLMIPPTQGLP